MLAKVEVILNTGAGSVAEVTVDAIKQAFNENSIDANVREVHTGEELLAAAKDAAHGEAEIVVAAGGDGTVSAVASKLVGTKKILGVLPIGTLNNLSKDLQIPQDLYEAVNVIAAGHLHEIDTGEVNGRYFINNSSIGLYPRIVRAREYQQRLGHGKWWAAAWAAWRFLWITPFLRVRLNLNGNEIWRKTPFVFVGNNDYEMDFYNIGRRPRLDQGNLSIYLLHRSGRTGLFLLVLRTLFGRLRQAREFEEFKAADLVVKTRRKKMLVAFDGEVAVMETPLNYSIHPHALRVIVPKPE